jgi:hypothetical protein
MIPIRFRLPCDMKRGSETACHAPDAGPDKQGQQQRRKYSSGSFSRLLPHSPSFLQSLCRPKAL